MTTYNFDVLVIGCGIAGMSAAVRLAESGLSVAILTRSEDPIMSNTYYAQGGIIYTTPDDTDLISDLMNATAETTNLEAADILLKKSGQILKDILLDKVKTKFSTREDGTLKRTKEASHSRARIIYKGDYTGKEIQTSFLKYINDKKRFPNITLFTGHTAVDLLTPEHHGVHIQQRYEKDHVVGVYALNQHSGVVVKLMAKNTILATGGLGNIYLHHSNSEGARGDGHAMAKRAGASLINMEFIQFHPTTLFEQSFNRCFLISEAVRGEGGILLNYKGDAFMKKYHPDCELAPRDIVARSILFETFETGHDCAYLDISHKDKDWIIDRFPTIYNHCLEKKIDITKNPIPVVPAAHYSCGGVKVNMKGETTLLNLYAVGEVSCTGLHGANRLASTALLEGLTWGSIAARDIISKIDNHKLYDSNMIEDWKFVGTSKVDMALIQQDWLTLKQTMWNYVGLIRTSERLSRANSIFSELFFEINRFYRNVALHDDLIGLRNAVEVSHLVLLSSGRNKRSVGCFYRKD